MGHSGGPLKLCAQRVKLSLHLIQQAGHEGGAAHIAAVAARMGLKRQQRLAQAAQHQAFGLRGQGGGFLPQLLQFFIGRQRGNEGGFFFGLLFLLAHHGEALLGGGPLLLLLPHLRPQLLLLLRAARGQLLQQAQHLVAAGAFLYSAAHQLLLGRGQRPDGLVVHLPQPDALGLLKGLLAYEVAVGGQFLNTPVALAQLDFAKLFQTRKVATVAIFRIAQMLPSL